ncbi:hypothetical protein ABI582_07560 [Pseudomonas sp. SAS7]|uniref:hypothetical protein n=1 Tax=Pseudomonas sp. SAS7 TaxID=3156487 RepID=UPI003F9B176D
MFQLQRSSLFFEQMDQEHSSIVQNIEIVFENSKALDISFHSPKHFILHLNNLLRSLGFFVEFSKKNPPAQWLKESVTSFISENQERFNKLLWLRNASSHQKLIIPEESLVTGLFRIKSSTEYKLKIGIGDHDKPAKYITEIALKDTSEIFHEMLALSSLMYMDLEHSALSECLGITRKWYFNLPSKVGKNNEPEMTDVYELASGFSAALLDHVCHSYASLRNIKFDFSFHMDLSEHNYINTLLEIDLYPRLFTKWWEEECSPLNAGVRYEYALGERNFVTDDLHEWAYSKLTTTPDLYVEQLTRIRSNSTESLFTEETIGEYFGFVTFNHWHFKRSFPGGPFSTAVKPIEIIKFQRLGNALFEEYKKKKKCAIIEAKEKLNHQIDQITGLIKKTTPKNNRAGK